MKMRFVFFILGLVVLLNSCFSPRHPDTFLSGLEKRMTANGTDWIVFTIEEMDTVKISRVCYKTIDRSKDRQDRLLMELYYPPDFNFKKKLPAIILYSDHRTLIDETPYVSWAQLIAASGMIAITYQGTVVCEEDFIDLAHYIKKQETFLGVNSRMIGILAGEAGIVRFAVTISTRIEDIPLQIRCAVCRIGRLPPPSEFAPDFPVVILNAGQGHDGIKHSVERYVKDATNLEINYKILEYTDGVHKFDVRQNTPKSREIIQQIIAFYKEELF